MTPQDCKELLEKEYEACYKSDSVHCDTWQVHFFTASANQRFVACVIWRLYELYHPGQDDFYNKVFAKDLKTGKSIGTSMVKFEAGTFYSEKDYVTGIVSVSDDGQVVYITKDGKEHTISFS